MRKILDAFYLSCAVLACISLVAMVLLILMQIATRFFDTHIPSSDDLSGYMVAWTTFLGLAYTMSKNDHIRVDILYNIISPRWQGVFNSAVNVLGSILLSVFLYYVFFLVKEAYDYGDTTSGFIPFPLWIIQLPYLLGVFALWVSLIDRLMTMIIKKGPITPQNDSGEKGVSP